MQAQATKGAESFSSMLYWQSTRFRTQKVMSLNFEVRIPCKEGQLQAFGAICEDETFWRSCGSNKGALSVILTIAEAEMKKSSIHMQGTEMSFYRMSPCLQRLIALRGVPKPYRLHIISMQTDDLHRRSR